jgi:hypothetical protein
VPNPAQNGNYKLITEQDEDFFKYTKRFVVQQFLLDALVMAFLGC